MHATSVLATSLDLGRAIACIRWTSVLKLMGAALVALGVVCELVGELAGRNAERTLEAAREAEFVRLAHRIDAIRPVPGYGRDDAALAPTRPAPVAASPPLRALGGSACLRIRRAAAEPPSDGL